MKKLKPIDGNDLAKIRIMLDPDMTDLSNKQSTELFEKAKPKLKKKVGKIILIGTKGDL